ncbi:MAG: response regulator [Oliverpabstia sp.]
MYKLLIIDDEEIICQTIANLIDWKSLNISLIGTCLDGVEAYHMILDESPDIVMTDIRMPGISGLELIERISATDLRTQFIILSGYGEFDYAKRAMKCGVKHYLLKPCDEQQIISCMQDVIQDIQKQILSENAAQNSNLEFQNLRETLINNMFREGISLPEISSSFFEPYEHYINLSDTPYQMCTLYFLEKSNLTYALTAIDSYFSDQMPGLYLHKIYINNILLVFFPNYDSEYREVDNFLKSLSFPKQTTSIQYERTLFLNLRLLLEYLIPKLKRYDTLYFISRELLVPNFNYGNIVQQMNQMIPSLLSQDSQQIADSMEKMGELLRMVSDRDFLIQLCDNLLISLATQLSDGTLSDITAFLSGLRQKNSLDDILNCTLDKVSEILTLSQSTQEHHSSFIDDLISYLEQHLEDSNLTLKWIAENYLYMNVNYVSRCFLKETGQKFSSYLMNLRVQKAKEILATQGNEKIQNVAELVGCGNNPYYFSKIFKKCTGMTPSAYVRKVGKTV